MTLKHKLLAFFQNSLFNLFLGTKIKLFFFELVDRSAQYLRFDHILLLYLFFDSKFVSNFRFFTPYCFDFLSSSGYIGTTQSFNFLTT